MCSLNHVKAVANMVKDEATGEMKIESMMENRLTGTAQSLSLVCGAVDSSRCPYI